MQEAFFFNSYNMVMYLFVNIIIPRALYLHTHTRPKGPPNSPDPGKELESSNLAEVFTRPPTRLVCLKTQIFQRLVRSIVISKKDPGDLGLKTIRLSS